MDHYVAYKGEESIAQTANKLRDAARLTGKFTFNIAKFVEECLPKFLRKEKLDFDFYDRDFPQDDPAHVSFDPLTLHVDRQIWAAAKSDDSDARFIIAHEIGHIILHDHSAKAFSNDKSAQLSFADEGHSAEWQANTFAYHFLLPDSVVEELDDFDRLQIMCDVPARLAIDRLTKVRRRKEEHRRKVQKIEGDFCTRCCNFSLVRENTLLKCTTPECKNVLSLF
jgi:Zn-dependent peptidase ImmA (M78 family)